MATHKPIKWAQVGKVAAGAVAGVVALATGAVVIQRLPPRDGRYEEDGEDQGRSGKDPVAHLSGESNSPAFRSPRLRRQSQPRRLYEGCSASGFRLVNARAAAVHPPGARRLAPAGLAEMP